MKYELESETGKHVVELEVLGSTIHARVDGREYTLKIFQPESGLYTLIVGHRVIEARVESNQNLGFVHVLIGDRAIGLRIADRKHRRSVAEHGVEGRVQVVARMPGKVVRVLTEAGRQIKAGEGILIVEAMKMQNEVKSPKSGRIVEINLREGQTINAGEVLVVIE